MYFVSQKCPEKFNLVTGGKKKMVIAMVKITLFFKNKIAEEVATGNEETDRC